MPKHYVIATAVMLVLIVSLATIPPLVVSVWASNGAGDTVNQIQTGQNIGVHLYFGDRTGNYLISEKRNIVQLGEIENVAQQIIEALISGPKQDLVSALPSGTSLRAVYFTADGTCYVDFSSAVSENHPGGCKAEILTLYSVVNSLILNMPEIKSVKILIEGNESQTLAGHIDIQTALRANMLIIR